MPISLNSCQVRRLRLIAQRLLPGYDVAETADTPEQVLKDVFAVQAQDLPAAYFSLRVRSRGLTAVLIDQARNDGSIAWTWSMRGTLHLVDAQDARWLVPFLGPDFTAADRSHFHQLGWDDASAGAAIRTLRAVISKNGGLTRAEITKLLQEKGYPHEGQATIHLLYYACLKGVLCSGPDRNGKPTFQVFENWLGEPQALPRQAAMERLARRYLEAYAPAGPEDFAFWSGLKPGDARRTWEAILPELVEVDAAGERAWMPVSHTAWIDETDDPSSAVHLLPRFDTLLMGYASRRLFLDAAFAKRVFPGGGWIKPALLVDGFIQGIWKTARQKDRLQVILEPFAGMDGDHTCLIEEEAQDIGRFLGLEASLVIDKARGS